MFGEANKMGAGKTTAKMERDPSRVQPPRNARNVAIANTEMKHQRRPKRRDVNQVLAADLQNMVNEMVTQVKTYKPPKVVPNPNRRASPKYVVDFTTTRSQRSLDFTPRYVLESQPSQGDEQPKRMARETFFQANQEAARLQKIKIGTQAKKLTRKANTEYYVILDQIKEAVIEPIILLNPHKQRLETLNVVLSQPINKDTIINVNSALRRTGLKKEYIQELQRLIRVLEDEYDIDEHTDIVGLYNDYKDRIQGVFDREKEYVLSLAKKAQGWLLGEEAKLGQEYAIYPERPSMDQRKRHGLIKSQYNDSIDLYKNYENQCVLILEKIEADEAKFMKEQLLDIYENSNKHSTYNIFESQELFRVLKEILTNLNHLYTTLDEMEKHRADLIDETKNTLDDIMVMFSGRVRLGGKKKKPSKAFSKKK